MARIVLGVVLILLFVAGLGGNPPSVPAYLAGGGALFLLPGVLCVVFGVRRVRRGPVQTPLAPAGRPAAAAAQPPAPDAPPAAWYPDPTDRHQQRFWDGARWTPGFYQDPLRRHQMRWWNGTSWAATVSDNGKTSTDPVPTAASAAPLQVFTQRVLSEKEKALIINTGIAAAVPFLIPFALLLWGIWRPVHARAKRILGTEIIIGSAVWGLLGILMIVSAATARPQIFPTDSPTQLLQWSEAGSDFSGGLVAYGAQPLEFNITFEGGESLDGDWSGDQAKLIIQGQRTVEGKPGNPRREWPSSIAESGSGHYAPTMKASLTLTNQDLHRELEVVATMRVQYPYKYGEKHYAVAGTTVTKTARFFVVTQEEMDLHTKQQAWQDRGSTLRAGLMLFGLSVFVGWLGFRVRRRGASRSPADFGQ